MSQKLKIGNIKIEIGSDDKCFEKTKVKDLIEKINAKQSLKERLNNGRLKFNDFVLAPERSLSFYSIKNNSEIEIEKYYDPYKHYEIKFTDKPDAILGENGGPLRALLSCGHAVDPNSLTAYCRSLIDQQTYKFTCPALVNGTKKCNKTWEYAEIRKIALLNESEMEFFERKLSELAAKEYVDYKECPKCHSFIEREDLKNLRVYCNICESINKKAFEFCWQCEQEWTVPISKASDTCGRESCENYDLRTLRGAKYVKLDSVQNLGEVPSIRSCPTCGKLAEHNRTACKNIFCLRCEFEFCFACLEITTVCKKTSSVYGPCSKPIAPIQTKIPVWKKN